MQDSDRPRCCYSRGGPGAGEHHLTQDAQGFTCQPLKGAYGLLHGLAAGPAIGGLEVFILQEPPQGRAANAGI